ncbi:hypothetical protein CK203_010296 [Vitis vinifera]|uniref:Uncharacterized protein n=1 Tax=Vitis vinifera TaxID=29760 RepID=A0A438JX85_VITVI|nr:hypothetical protein CK203_010296 [Vitis vinifera]
MYYHLLPAPMSPLLQMELSCVHPLQRPHQKACKTKKIQGLTRSITQPSFPMDKAQFLLVGLPLFLFFSDIINLFTPLPPKPPPHHHHQQPQPKPQSAPLDFPT